MGVKIELDVVRPTIVLVLYMAPKYSWWFLTK